ncbi:ERF family protein [Acinetobacter colistiniresistens]|uniref:ERF family protein n=1 Tax=Acinetobacter colistiniresistens TaxID=280145 RepID=UPI00124FDF48|nr:ERF family protein [Acinetobacter colistiniresistens]
MTTKTKILVAINTIHRVVAEFGVQANGSFSGKWENSPKFSYQKTDDIYELISPLMASENILCLPNVVDEKESIVPTATGQMIRTKVKVEYTFMHAEDGSSVTVSALGEETDTGGKSSSKAMTAAHKAALKQMFLIPKRGAESQNQPPQQQPSNVRTVQTAKAPRQNIRTVHSEVGQTKKEKTVTPGQLSWLSREVAALGMGLDSLLSFYKIDDLSQLPFDKYDHIRKRIVTLKQEQLKPAQ